MISPEKFRSNEFTMDDNVFQSRKHVNTEVSKKVMKEFEKLKNLTITSLKIHFT